jgi:hypothetical protein
MRTGLDEQNAALDSHEKRHAAFLHLARLTARAVAAPLPQPTAKCPLTTYGKGCRRTVNDTTWRWEPYSEDGIGSLLGTSKQRTRAPTPDVSACTA